MGRLKIQDVIEDLNDLPGKPVGQPAATAEPPPPSFTTLKLADIDESPTNPRKDFNREALQELAADISKRGVLQPVLVRPKGDRHELVVGHRRFRAAKLAGLSEVPALVRTLSDGEAAEEQLVENLKRADLTPLELAHGYRQLMETQKCSVDDLAAKVGKKRQAVYNALKLLQLGTAGRDALAEGKLSASVAQLLARVPMSMQEQATKELLEGRYGKTEPMSYRDAEGWLADRYTVSLVDAPFEITDAELSPTAGACKVCPKRSGTMKDAFPDLKSPDVCTDPGCYREKVALFAKRAAAERGMKLIEGKAAEKVVDQWGGVKQDSDYVNATTIAQQDGADRKYQQLLTPAAKAELGALVITPKGEVVEVYQREGLAKALKESGKLKPPKEDKGAVKDREEAKRLKAEAERSERLTAALIAALVAAVEKKGLTPKLVRLMVRHFVGHAHELYGRRGVEYPDGAHGVWKEGMLDQVFKKPSAAALAGLLFEAVCETSLHLADAQKEACELLGVDRKKVEAELKAAEKAAAASPAPAKKGKAA